jgi:multidrug efflux pump subunit AcrB
LTRAYAGVLRFSLEHWYVLVFGAVLLAAGSWFAYQHTGSDLLPAMDEGGFILDYITPAGSSLEETNRMVGHIEQILRNTPEVESTSRRTGLQLGLAAVTEANRGDFSVKLKRKRDRDVEEVIADVRAKVVKAEPLVDVEFPQVLQDMIGDLTSAPEPVNIKLFSQDPAPLRTWAPKIAAALKKVPGVVDIEDGIENSISGPSLTFKVDPVAAARTGFTPQEVEVDTSAILQGEPATNPVVLNGRPYTIRVRLPEENRASLDAIRSTLLVSGTGKTSSLGDLATFTETPGETEIRRENLQRDVVVIARFENVSLGEGMDRVKKAVNDLHIPANIRVEYGGQYQEQQKSFKDLVVVLALAVVLVFMVLLFEFGGFSAPIAVLSSAILSVSGVFVALLITHTTFNLSSFMGLIMVIGIVAKNGILLLDADEKFRREGLDAEESMIRAGERRLRPIMMTALATMAGMIPLALGWGAGSQMLQPLAIAVIGGILASMVLSLVVTPAVFYYLGGKNA